MAQVKKIRLHSEYDDKVGLWEVYYDFSEDESEFTRGVAVCPIVWRAHAKDELDIWVQFKRWFNKDSKGEPNNVIWL
jgi:hypothetical protein